VPSSQGSYEVDYDDDAPERRVNEARAEQAERAAAIDFASLEALYIYDGLYI